MKYKPKISQRFLYPAYVKGFGGQVFLALQYSVWCKNKK